MRNNYGLVYQTIIYKPQTNDDKGNKIDIVNGEKVVECIRELVSRKLQCIISIRNIIRNVQVSVIRDFVCGWSNETPQVLNS